MVLDQVMKLIDIFHHHHYTRQLQVQTNTKTVRGQLIKVPRYLVLKPWLLANLAKVLSRVSFGKYEELHQETFFPSGIPGT